MLGIVGIFLPILWLIGAILPAKRGSRYEVQQAMRDQAQIAEMDPLKTKPFHAVGRRQVADHSHE